MFDLQTAVADVPLVFIDVETTGFSPVSGDRVVEISMVKWQGGEIVDDLGSLVSPQRPIPRAAMDVHGIGDWDVLGAPIFSDLADDVYAFVDGTVVVGHNVEFDLRFLNYELANAGREQWQGTGLCTLSIARKMFHLRNNKLTDIAKFMGLQVTGEHRATDDVWTTIQVFQRIVEQAVGLSKKARGTDLVTLHDMVRLQQRPVNVPVFSLRQP